MTLEDNDNRLQLQGCSCQVWYADDWGVMRCFDCDRSLCRNEDLGGEVNEPEIL